MVLNVSAVSSRLTPTCWCWHKLPGNYSSYKPRYVPVTLLLSHLALSHGSSSPPHSHCRLHQLTSHTSLAVECLTLTYFSHESTVRPKILTLVEPTVALALWCCLRGSGVASHQWWQHRCSSSRTSASSLRSVQKYLFVLCSGVIWFMVVWTQLNPTSPQLNNFASFVTLLCLTMFLNLHQFYIYACFIYYFAKNKTYLESNTTHWHICETSSLVFMFSTSKINFFL